MTISTFQRRKVIASLIVFVLLLATILSVAAIVPGPAAVAAPSPPYTYDPSSTGLSVTAGDSASLNLTFGLSFVPEPGWWVNTTVEAMSPGPFTFVFDPQFFTLNRTVPSQLVHITVTAPEGTEPGTYVQRIKAKQVSSSGPPGVGRGEGCEVTITVVGTPTPTPTPTSTPTPSPTPTTTPPPTPTATPPPTPSPTPTPGGRCFIATAAYGTPLAEEIGVLRQFRDEYLLTNPAGQLLVSLYYRSSPPVAQFIDDHPSLKPMVRVGLMPAVALSAVAVDTTWTEKMALAGGLALLSLALVVGLTIRARGVKM